MSNLTLKDTGAFPDKSSGNRRTATGHTIGRAQKPRPALPKRQPDVVSLDAHAHGNIESRGPGKNVLIRNKFRREDSGTHETLKILDDSMIESGEDEGFDPYNTGQFDRSRNWDRSRK
jgi:hypothetical protein